jgi:predicted DNA-binding transcriptional regulator YafY
MSTTQDTITVTLMRPVAFTIPRTLTEHVSPQLVDDALDAFVSRAVGTPGALYYSRDDLAVIAAAMLEGSAVCVRYEHDDEVTARVLFPSAIFLTKDNHICVRAFCTYRREMKCFRVDRMACVHSVTMPGEVAA